MPFRIFKRIGLISYMGYSLMMLLVGVTRFGGGGYFYDYFLITLPLALGLMLYNMED